MKSPRRCLAGLLCLFISSVTLPAQVFEASKERADAAAAKAGVSVLPWQAKSRSEHQTEWFSVRYLTNPITGRVRVSTNSFIELATGLNRRDAQGRWAASDAAFQITANGAEVGLAAQRIRILGNINTVGAVEMEKDGVKLQGHPLCVAYYDPVDGRSELLAEVKDAIGWLVSSNEIVFSNCFDGLRASIRYRSTLDGLEQDLILHERPALTPAEIGFSGRTRLELFTEWVGKTPMPQQESRLLATEKDTELRKQMVEPDFTDSTLTFGSLRMGRGKAFTEGTLSGGKIAEEILVGKRFEIIDGRKILIEALPLEKVQSILNKLPVATVGGGLTNASLRLATNTTVQLAGARTKGLPLLGTAGEASASKTSNLVGVRADPSPAQPIRVLPAKRLAHAAAPGRIQTAAATNSKPETRNAELAFVLDWQALTGSGASDFTFRAGETYLCSGNFNLSGTTRIQGAVVKFAPYPATARLRFLGPVVCETEPYQPAWFVSKFDASLGEVLDYANTTPALYTGAIELTTTGNKLKHLRVRHAGEAVRGWDVDVRHSQFKYCGTAFYMPETTQGSGPCRVGNVLVTTCDRAFGGGYYNAIATHLTAVNCDDSIATDPSGRSSATFINSLLSGSVAISHSIPNSYFIPASPSAFQTVGFAAHYLVNGSSYRGAGTTAIDPTLLAELKQTTTHPPIVLSGSLTVNTTLAPAPQVVRNTSATPNPDVGYAYDAMDYLARGITVGNGVTPTTLLLTDGVVIGIDPTVAGSGIHFGEKVDLISVGQPGALNRILSADFIQESPVDVNQWTPYVTLSGAGVAGNPTTSQMRFTDLAALTARQAHFGGGASGFQQFTVRDSQIRGGAMTLVSGNDDQLFAFTNTLFEVVNATIHPYAAATFEWWNNLFRGGRLNFDYLPSTPPVFRFRDNLFDGTEISQLLGLSVDGHHNAYVQVTGGTTTRLDPGSVTDPILTANLAYEIGPFGRYYLPASATQLINQGSGLASDCDLFDYTTQTTSGSKEGGSQVDIGLHYFADLPVVTVVASGGAATAKESGLVAGQFSVSRSSMDVSAALTVNYSLAGSTAGNGTDYQFLSGSVTIPANQSSATISIVPLDDSVDESDETVVLTLSTHNAYNLGAPKSATVTILDKPTVSVAASIATAKESGLVAGQFTVTRAATDLTLALPVIVQLTGVAASGTDYTAVGTTVTIPAGQASVTVAVNPLNDSVDEPDETVVLTVLANIAYNVAATPNHSATVTILDKPTVSVMASVATAKESGLVAGQFTISRAAADVAAALPVTVQLTGTATSGTDCIAIGTTVTIPAGQPSVTVAVSPVNDSVDESDETVVLTVVANSTYNVAVSPNNSATVTILDKPTVSVAANIATANESGLVAGQFTVSRAASDFGATLSVTVQLTGTATSGADYTAIGTTVTIPAGQSSVTVSVSPLNDSVDEPDEAVMLTVLANTAYNLGSPSTATVTILDKPTVAVAANVATAKESDLVAGQFTISRSATDIGAALPVTVHWGGTASSGADYSAIGTTVTIPAGQASMTVAVSPLDDTADEMDETVVLNLVANSSYNVAGTPNNSATVTIVDEPFVNVTATIPTAQEAGPVVGRFTFSRATTDTSTPLTIYYSLGGIAKNGIDYISLNGQIAIPAGSASIPLDVTPVNDTEYEGTETIQIELAPDFSYEMGATASAALNLQDNDKPTVAVVAWDREASEPRPGVSANVGNYTISRSGDTRDALSVTFSFSGGTGNGTAVNGVDFQVISTTITIPPQEREIGIVLTPVSDGSYEGTEQAILTLQNSVNYQLDPLRSQASVAITDAEIPTVRVISSAGLHSEGGSAPQFIFERTAPANGGSTLPLKVAFRLHGSATNGVDYARPTPATSITIPGNAISQSLPISLINDSEPEQVETIIATIVGSVTYLIGTDNSAILRIDDNESVGYIVTVLKPHISHNAVPSPDYAGRFRITRVGSAAGASTISYQTEYLQNDGLRHGLLALSAQFAAGESNFEKVWDGNTGSEQHLEIRVPGTPIARMPCYQSGGVGAPRYVTMSLGSLNFVEQEIQEGSGNAVLSITGPTNALVRIAVTSGSADFSDIVSSVPFTFDLPTQRWGFWMTLSSAGTGSITFSAPHEGLPENTEYMAFRFDPIVAIRGPNWSIDPVQAVKSAYWPGISYKGSTGFITTFSEYNNYAVLRIRNMSSGGGIQPDPPVDADLDGLTDTWERNYASPFPVVNGFNGPILPDDPDADPDRDGLSNREESLLANSSPYNSDSDGNGINDFLQNLPEPLNPEEEVEVKIRVVDAGKVGVQNCAVCHTTRVKVGDSSAYNPTRDPAFEKSVRFRKGKSYPIRLETLILPQNRSGVQTTTPSTSARYTAQLLPPASEAPQFFVDDPQSIMGVDKAWSASLNTKQATLIVPKLELAWVAKGDNLPIEDNNYLFDAVTPRLEMMPGGGKRIFVGNKTPGDTNPRNSVLLRIKSTPALPGKIMYLKSFDVDDATDPAFDVADVIDSNGTAGDDNLDGFLIVPKPGRFVANQQQTYQVALDGNGEADVELLVGGQPGNNYRVAVTPFAQTDLNILQVANSAAAGFVSPDDQAVATFAGSVSPMLTVWRKLHLEADTMNSPPPSGEEQNFEAGLITEYRDLGNGRARIWVKAIGTITGHWFDVDRPNAYEGGKLEIDGIGVFKVVSGTIVQNSSQGIFRFVEVVEQPPGSGLPGLASVNRNCKIYDDDYNYLANDPLYPSPYLNLPSPLLPMDRPATSIGINLNMTTYVIQKIRKAFFPAYIDVLDTATMTPSPNQTIRIPFKRNIAEISGAHYGGFPSAIEAFGWDLIGKDSGPFWCYRIVFTHQGDSNDDSDPFSEDISPTEGETVERQWWDFGGPTAQSRGYSVIHLENIRDTEFAGVAPSQFLSAAASTSVRSSYFRRIYGVTAHEIGHAPGRRNGALDHGEGELLSIGGKSLWADAPVSKLASPYERPGFSPASIIRFRKSLSWTD